MLSSEQPGCSTRWIRAFIPDAMERAAGCGLQAEPEHVRQGGQAAGAFLIHGCTVTHISQLIDWTVLPP